MPITSTCSSRSRLTTDKPVETRMCCVRWNNTQDLILQCTARKAEVVCSSPAWCIAPVAHSADALCCSKSLASPMTLIMYSQRVTSGHWSLTVLCTVLWRLTIPSMRGRVHIAATTMFRCDENSSTQHYSNTHLLLTERECTTPLHHRHHLIGPIIYIHLVGTISNHLCRPLISAWKQLSWWSWEKWFKSFSLGLKWPILRCYWCCPLLIQELQQSGRVPLKVFCEQLDILPCAESDHKRYWYGRLNSSM